MASCLPSAGASRAPCPPLCQRSQRAAEDAELLAQCSRCLSGEVSTGLGFLHTLHVRPVPPVCWWGGFGMSPAMVPTLTPWSPLHPRHTCCPARGTCIPLPWIRELGWGYQGVSHSAAPGSEGGLAVPLVAVPAWGGTAGWRSSVVCVRVGCYWRL